MKLTTNSIITIETKERYLILNKAVVDNHEYFLVMGLDDNNNTITSKVAIFESDYSDDDIYVIKIEDRDKISLIMQELKNDMK